jgi:hypothetical protein
MQRSKLRLKFLGPSAVPWRVVNIRPVDRPVRHAQGGNGAQELPGSRVDVADAAAQPDGAGAGGGVPDVVEPGVVSGVVDPTKFDFYTMDCYRHLAEDRLAETLANEVIQASTDFDGTE